MKVACFRLRLWALSVLLVGACGDSAVGMPDSDASSGTSSTSTLPTTTDATSSTSGTTAESGTSTTTGGACVAGQLQCACGPDEACDEGVCILGECTPASGACPSEFDLVCDEPDACAPGSDPYDCCASPQDGVCEEHGGGGACPKGSDYFDCGACLWVDDGECDEGTSCPVGSDPTDCCATPNDGVCDEQGQGGRCPDGSDPFDCDSCPFTDNGECDEPDFCAPGTDTADCCAVQEDGICEEQGQGGTCPDGSDPFDCGECPFTDDGFCDEPDFCPMGTDSNDCCATPDDGVCEEVDQGGMCPDGSDSFDCGECPYTGDGFCDEGDLCPMGTDSDDCCATPDDGVCEEVDQGGMCPDGTDAFDCGECPFTDDGFCDEGDLCPAGTDSNDCCATPEDGACEEVGQGGMCPDGSDYYDCGECPYTDDDECDEPDLCPPGTDASDCA